MPKETVQPSRVDLARGKEKESQIRIRILSPENPRDLEIARFYDEKTLDALNPEDESHDLMTEEALKRWLVDTDKQCLRSIEGEDGTPLGFAYYYRNRSRSFLARIAEIRRRTKIPKNQSIWEMNFCMVVDAVDEVVQQGVGRTLKDFSKKFKRETAVVMFAEADERTQDNIVLESLGFRSAGPINYDIDGQVDSDAYVGLLAPNKQ